jgi:HNH endonuclease
MSQDRKKLKNSVKIEVLTEAGYRCAVPTCRNILALDIHHIIEVSEGGSDEASNLIALCPTCHALYHRREISRESIYVWKGILVSLSQAFDQETIDYLIFLNKPESLNLTLSGDAVLKIARLIANNLVTVKRGGIHPNSPIRYYSVSLTRKGKALVDAWLSGNRDAVKQALLSENL